MNMRNRIPILICSLVFCCFSSISREATGQEPAKPVPRTGLIPELPLTPELPPRPLTTEGQPWKAPTGEQQQPTSSFIDSLKANDASIEVVVGQGRLLTLSGPLATEDGVGVIAVGDPTILDFEVLPDQRMLRLTGRRVGVTDLSFVAADGRSHSFEVNVGYDLILVTAQLKQIFPDALINLHQLREHLVVEGQARSPEQVQQILDTLTALLTSMQTSRSQRSTRGAGPAPAPMFSPEEGEAQDGGLTAEGEPLYDEGVPVVGEAPDQLPIGLAYEGGERPNLRSTSPAPQLINLLRVPGSQQVMLKVTVAELSRRAFRAMGVDLIIDTEDFFLDSILSGSGNVNAIFNGGEVDILMNALRTNSILTVLAEPNLVTMSGYPAQFLVGGEIPIPVQTNALAANSVDYKEYGTQLVFVPYVQDDGVIRLTVRPEVSRPDPTFIDEIAGLNVTAFVTRNATTTVELREGQTLAMAGLLSQVKEAETSRIPLVGDLPILGNLFRNTEHRVDETELLVLVTPHIVDGLDSNQCIPLPGQEIKEPCDLELFLLGRIEGRTGLPYRATTNWDDPLGIIRLQQIESHNVYGPYGFSK